MAVVNAVATDYYWWTDSQIQLFVKGAWRTVESPNEQTKNAILTAFCHQKEVVVWGRFDDSNDSNKITNVQVRYRNGDAGGATG